MKPNTSIRSCRQSRSGYTLTEIMVAMMVLAIGMAGVYSFVSLTTRQQRGAHLHYISTVIANNRIEHAKNIPFGSLQDLRENGVRVDEIGVHNDSGAFVRRTLITPNWENNETLTRVMVSVEYPHPGARDGQTTTNTLSTLIASQP